MHLSSPSKLQSGLRDNFSLHQRLRALHHVCTYAVVNRGNQIILEQKGADCLVLGNSSLAAAISASLTRRGKKVIHIADIGLKIDMPAPESLRPLILPDVNVHISRLADEGASYLRGLELQMSTPLLHRCQSLDLGVPLAAAGADASRSGSGQGNASLQAAIALEQLAESCKETHVKLMSLKEGELITPFPMLRPKKLMGLLQPDGAILNARTTHEALLALAKRNGALIKDHLKLRGWQDTGSAIRVHASSALQSDVISVFEAEQLILAPGDWVPEALNLFGLKLNVQMHERLSISCPSTGDLSRLPLLRYWGGLPSTAEEHEERERAGLWLQQQLLQEQQLEQQQGKNDGRTTDARTANKSGCSASTSLGTSRSSNHARGAQWVLLPPCGARHHAKLAASSQSPVSSRVIKSGWEWQPPHTGARSRPDAGSPQLPMRTERRQAGALLKGLGAEDQALLADAEHTQVPCSQHEQVQQGQARVAATPAIDLLTPDGLPILGWHPGFEQGRVLVACSASGHFGWEEGSHTDDASRKANGKQGGIQEQQEGEHRSSTVGSSSGNTTSACRGNVNRSGGHSSSRFKNHSQRVEDEGSKTSSRSQASSDQSPMAGSYRSACTDGYQLSLALANAASNAVVCISDQGEGMGESGFMDLCRPCLKAEIIPEIVQGETLQNELLRLQDGSAWRAQSSMSDEELQAQEEREVVVRRMKAGSFGKLRPQLDKQRPKHFFGTS